MLWELKHLLTNNNLLCRPPLKRKLHTVNTHTPELFYYATFLGEQMLGCNVTSVSFNVHGAYFVCVCVRRPVNYVLVWLSVVGPLVGLDVPLKYSTQLHLPAWCFSISDDTSWKMKQTKSTNIGDAAYVTLWFQRLKWVDYISLNLFIYPWKHCFLFFFHILFIILYWLFWIYCIYSKQNNSSVWDVVCWCFYIINMTFCFFVLLDSGNKKLFCLSKIQRNKDWITSK